MTNVSKLYFFYHNCYLYLNAIKICLAEEFAGHYYETVIELSTE